MTSNLTEETTFFAKIRYSNGLAVSDENGTELPVRSVVVNDTPVVGFDTLSSLEALITNAAEGLQLTWLVFTTDLRTLPRLTRIPSVSRSQEYYATNGTISVRSIRRGPRARLWDLLRTSRRLLTPASRTTTLVCILLMTPRRMLMPQARRQDANDFFKPYNALSKNDIWYDLDSADGTHLSGNFATSITADTWSRRTGMLTSPAARLATTIFLGSPNLVSTVKNSSYNSSTGELTFSAPASWTCLRTCSLRSRDWIPIRTSSLVSIASALRGRIYYRPLMARPLRPESPLY